MIYEAFVALLGLMAIASGLAIFLLKDVLHSVLALVALFLSSSALLIMLGQPLLAIVQLFIMVGGISTFVFAGVASAPKSEFAHVEWSTLIAVAALLFLSAGAALMSIPGGNGSNVLTRFTLSGSFNGHIAELYVILLGLLGVAIGGIALLRQIGRKGVAA